MLKILNYFLIQLFLYVEEKTSKTLSKICPWVLIKVFVAMCQLQIPEFFLIWKYVYCENITMDLEM